MQFSLDSKRRDRHIHRKTKYTKQQGWNKENDNPTDVKEHDVSAMGKDNISCQATELLTKDTPANGWLDHAISYVLVKIYAFLHNF